LQELVGLLKSIFDVSASISDKKFGAFEELYVDSADAETIWEELQSRNRPQKRFFKTQSKRLLKKLVHDREDGNEEEEGEEDEDVEMEVDDQEGDHSSADGGSDEEEEDVPEATDEDEEEEDEEDEEEDMEGDDNDYDDDGSAEEGSEAGESGGRRSGIEADVDAMESWLDDFEAMEERHRDKEERREARARGDKGHKGAVEVRRRMHEWM
jgi:hypothetical protein